MAARQERDQVEEESNKREGPRDATPLSAAAIETKRTPAPPEPGLLLDDRYELEEIIGTGGAGIVFRARDKLLGDQVAVKILHRHHAADGKWRRRLFREVSVARAIRHPNVCRVFEFGHSNNDWYVTMEFGAGTLRDDFENWAKADARPAFSTRLTDATALCSGLAAIHAVGIVHRDVTPSNILRMRDGRLVITDFGLAIGANDKTTFHGGVPKYMAPEVLAGAPSDQRADVWQLGLLLHELLFGRPQWTADRTALISPVPASATASEHELWVVCSSCLSLDPALRPPSAVVVAGALAAAATAKPYSLFDRLLRRARRLGARRWLHWSVAAMLVIASAAILTPTVILKPRMCTGASARAADVWSDQRQGAVKRSFESTGHAGAGATFATVDRVMRAYLIQWTDAYVDACEATHVRGEQSSEVLDLRMACLGEELQGARALTSTFANANESVVDSAALAVANFGDLHRCQDPHALRTGLSLPKNTATRAEVRKLQEQLAVVRARTEAGQAAALVGSLDGLADAARKTGYCPLIAYTLTVKGHVEATLGKPTFRQSLETAIWTGESCGADQAVALAATDLAFPQERGDLAFGERWASLAKAAIDRTGGNPRLESWMLNNRASTREMKGDRAGALADLKEALRLKESVLGPDHLDVGISLGNLGELLVLMGRLEEALPISERAVKISEQWVGRDHPWTAVNLVQRGNVYEALGRLDDAIESFRGGLAILTARDPDDPKAAYAHAGLGRIQMRRQNLPGAIRELELARTLLESLADGLVRAGVEFDLGRAYYEAGRKVEGHRLAEGALLSFHEAGVETDRDRVQHWLDGHPG